MHPARFSSADKLSQKELLKRHSLGRKIVIFGTGFIFTYFLGQRDREELYLVFGFLYALNLLAPYLKSFKNTLLLWYLGYCLDLTYTGFLIFQTGGLASPFVLFYPLIILGIAVERLYLRDFLITGFLGYLSYTLALFFLTQSFSFYFTLSFWLLCSLITLTFVSALFIFRSLTRDQKKLRELAQALRQKNECLEKLAVTDETTGLYNCRYFHQRLKEELDRAVRYQRNLTLLMLDLDDFKRYNDAHGHLQGDELLRELGVLLRKEVRQGDIPCRYGGEEFAIIVPEGTIGEGLRLAERLQEKIASYPFPGREVFTGGILTASVGIANYPQDAHDWRTLVNRADSALCLAKQHTKNRVQTYHSLSAGLHMGIEGKEKLLGSTLETMVAVINAKDRYTRGHSERVAEYTVALARELNFPPEKVRLLGYAAFLHDIGKIEIDREILTKEGPLTDNEWEIVKKHTLFGISIVEPVQAYQGLLPAIKYHHERWDGKGYPEGLKDDEIPLEARILALADAFDAMRSNRPYRQALPLEEALEEIRREAGTQFDPELAEVFIRVISRLSSTQPI